MLKKNNIRWCLSVCLLALTLHASAWTKVQAIDGPTWQDYAASSYAGGDGTKNNPYKIANAEQLARLAKMVNDGTMKSGQYQYFELTADIDLAKQVEGKDVCWVPIGHLERYAYCYFSGKGHTIKNMKIVSSETTHNGGHFFGLFGTLYGSVASLNIKDAEIKVSAHIEGSTSIGLLAGDCNPSKSSTRNNAIYQCTAQGGIALLNQSASRKKNNYVGGLIGDMTCRTSMAQCCTDVWINVKSGSLENETFVGGIIGRTEANKFLLYDCAAHANIVVFNEKDTHVGGIVGQAYMNIVACATTGKIIANSATSVGGIVGQFTANRVAANISMMELQGGRYLGGIVGHDRDKETIVNNIFSGHIGGTCSERVGGIIGLCKNATNSNPCQGNLVTGTFRKHVDADKCNPIINPSTVQPKDCFIDNAMADFSGPLALPHTKMTSGVRAGCPLAGYYDGFKWEYKEGFYPRLTLNDAYIKANTDDGIRAINNEFGITAPGAPLLLPDYAWLASVPLQFRKVTDGLCKAYRLDYPFPIDNVEADGKTFTFNLPDDHYNMSIADGKLQLLSPGEEVIDVKYGSLTKRLYINVVVGTTYEWGKDYDVSFEGTGAQSTPYLIRTARQLEKALRTNKAGEYYKLAQDIWLNRNLVSINGNRDEAQYLNLEMSDYLFTWNGHLDGDGHYLRGLNMDLSGREHEQQRTGLVAVNKGVIENLAVVDAFMNVNDYCDAASASLLAGTNEGTIRNCIVQGVVSSYRAKTVSGICGTLAAGGVLEDCIAAVVFRKNSQVYSFTNANELSATNCRRCLSLSVISSKPQTSYSEGADCIYPEGFMPHYNTTQEDMVLGTGLGDAENWTSKRGRYPMLKVFENTGYGLLLSLPVKAEKDNPLYDMKHHTEFVGGGVEWTASHPDCFDVSNELEVIAPKQMGPSGEKYIMAAVGDDKVLIPVTLNNDFTKGIKFASGTVEGYCRNYFDTNKDGRLSLDEIGAVSNAQLKSVLQMMGNRCDRFPELKYFKGITELTDELNNLPELWDVRLPAGLKRLGANAFKGCTALATITLPNSLTTIDPHPFYGSNIIDVFSDSIDCFYKVREHMIFDGNDNLVAYPNALKTSAVTNRSLTLSGKVNKILKGAIYRVEGLDTIYINAPRYDSFTQLAPGGIIHSKASSDTESDEMVIYINDATTDGVLYKQYQQDSEWADYNDRQRLKRYYPLTVTDALYATLYIGFNTKLPAELKPFIAHSKYTTDEVVTLVATDNKLPAETPVVIKAQQAGTYILEPYGGRVETIPLYLNKLIGTGRDGKPVYQSDASEGNLLTLGHSTSGQLGFYYYKNANGTVPPYKAYLNVGSITNRAAVFDETGSRRAYGEGMADGFRYEIKKTFWSRKYYAVLTDYTGSSSHLKVPNSVTAVVEGSQQEVPVTEMGRALFRDHAELKSIDLSGCTNLEPCPVSRSSMTSAFAGLSNDVFVFMPDNRDHMAGYNDPNVIIGDKCSWLSLNAGSAFRAPYDFTAARATYDGELWANVTPKDTEGRIDQCLDIDRNQGTEEALAPQMDDAGDGAANSPAAADDDLFYTYSPKAYTICLPFTIDLSKQTDGQNVVLAYELVSVTKEQEFLFDNVTSTLEAGKPYLVIVGMGHVMLETANVRVVRTPQESAVDDAYNMSAMMGKWKGNFSPLSKQQLSGENAYLMQSNGTWRSVAHATDDFKELPSFSAYFAPSDSYTGQGGKTVINGAGEGITFDGDMEATDIQTPYIHVIDRRHGDRYFDMNGRELQARPDRGVYIYKGKKYFSK